MSAPNLLRGSLAIGARLSIGPRFVEHLHRSRMIPTFRIPGDGASHATVAALDEWRALPSTKALLRGLRLNGNPPATAARPD